MKNLTLMLVILVAAAIVFALFSRSYNKTKTAVSTGKGKKKISSKETQVVAIGPDGKEMIISDYGEESDDGAQGTSDMEDRVDELVTNIESTLGGAVDRLEFKIYDKTGIMITGGLFDPTQKQGSITGVNTVLEESDDRAREGCISETGKFYNPPCATQIAADRYISALG